MTARRVRVLGSLFRPVVPAGAVYIGRQCPGLPGSPFANPHKAGLCRACGVEHDQAAAVAAYVRHLLDRPELVARARAELVGLNLACWCQMGEVCHGDVLAEVIAGRSLCRWCPPTRTAPSALGFTEVTLW